MLRFSPMIIRLCGGNCPSRETEIRLFFPGISPRIIFFNARVGHF
jgi:hypothetical protein